MSKAKKYYWLKLQKDFFKRHDIRIIESMPNGKDYILFYLKLLCESTSHEGFLRFSETIPYNEEMLSTITNTNIDIVRSAVKIFSELHMIDILDDGTYYMNEVQKMLGFETEWARKKREYREKQNLVKDENKTTQRQCLEKEDNVRQELEIEIEKELDIEKEIKKDKEDTYVQSDTITHEQPIITITLNDKSEYPIYQKMIDDYKELYPAVDIIQELKKMKGWCNSNPTKRKTKRGILRFINSWLARKQDESSTYKPMINVNEFQSKEISLVTEKPSDEEFARLRQEIEERIGG